MFSYYTWSAPSNEKATMIPKPNKIEERAGVFPLVPTTTVVGDAGLDAVACVVRQYLGAGAGVPESESTGSIRFELNDQLEREEYRLSVRPDGVTIAAGAEPGAFWGFQSFMQLLPARVYRQPLWSGMQEEPATYDVPCCEITDAPRFAWRGVMLDVARHFLPVREVLRFIDLMAIHKLNVLHLHLTDDQGWRVQIHRYPRLTEIGSWRRESQVGALSPLKFDGRPHGGFYTQDDLRHIVAYAATRQVTVVPEIDAPGHMQAAIAAYPELGPSRLPQLDVRTTWGTSENVLNVEDSTIDFVRHVLDEVMKIFPSQYIAIGGDECPKTQWREDPVTQETMRRRGLPDEERLQSWFVDQLVQHLAGQGRQAIGWDEIIEGGLPDGAAVMSWRGMTGARVAANASHDVVVCPYDRVYLDHRQSDSDDEPIPAGIVLDLESVYEFDPIPEGLASDKRQYVLGGQANIWSELIDSPRMLDYFAFPRVSAVAERLWSPPATTFLDFKDRLGDHLLRLDAMDVEYRPKTGSRPWQRRPGVVGIVMTPEECETILADLVINIADRDGLAIPITRGNNLQE